MEILPPEGRTEQWKEVGKNPQATSGTAKKDKIQPEQGTLRGQRQAKGTQEEERQAAGSSCSHPEGKGVMT